MILPDAPFECHEIWAVRVACNAFVQPGSLAPSVKFFYTHQTRIAVPIGSVCMLYMVSHLPSTKTPVLRAHQSTIHTDPSWDIAAINPSPGCIPTKWEPLSLVACGLDAIVAAMWAEELTRLGSQGLRLDSTKIPPVLLAIPHCFVFFLVQGSLFTSSNPTLFKIEFNFS